ncbi:MAG: hypothetical protein HC847_26535 [Hydrococcus sp. RU_2_2]|nr:hypothetical protein [Hydrococcus sp. RU_2_2]NJP22011.1 hypothetical protein [Hydrococcus sp. CRU_1_1]
MDFYRYIYACDWLGADKTKARCDRAFNDAYIAIDYLNRARELTNACTTAPQRT